MKIGKILLVIFFMQHIFNGRVFLENAKRYKKTAIFREQAKLELLVFIFKEIKGFKGYYLTTPMAQSPLTYEFPHCAFYLTDNIFSSNILDQQFPNHSPMSNLAHLRYYLCLQRHIAQPLKRFCFIRMFHKATCNFFTLRNCFGSVFLVKHFLDLLKWTA